MTDVTSGQAHSGQGHIFLGVGRLVSRTFSILFSRFGLFLIPALLVQLALVVLLFGTVGLAAGGFASFFQDLAIDPGVLTGAAGVGAIAFFVLSLLVTCFIQAYQTAAGFDAYVADRRAWSHYMGVGFRRMVPLAVVGFVVMLGMVLAIGGIAFAMGAIGLPAWLGAIAILFMIAAVASMIAAMVPAIVVENRWFSAVSRSFALTKGYRLGALGFLLLMVLIVIGVSLLLSVLLGTTVSFGIGNTGALGDAGAGAIGAAVVISQVAQAALGVLVTAFMMAGFAALYARLREIKEGMVGGEISNVFD